MATTGAILYTLVQGAQRIDLGDRVLLRAIRLALDGMAARLEDLGVGQGEIEDARASAMEVARNSYVDVWFRQVYEAEEGPVDEESDRDQALQAFERAARGEW